MRLFGAPAGSPESLLTQQGFGSAGLVETSRLAVAPVWQTEPRFARIEV